jgi:hypothetical protein
MAGVPIFTHWSGPPQHAGYHSGQTGHGDGWPERGGAGPQPSEHIHGLERREPTRPWQWQRTGLERAPRASMTEERRIPRAPGRDSGPNRMFPVKQRGRSR